MISNIVVSLFGAAYNWPLGAAISFCMLSLLWWDCFFSRAPGEEMELLVSTAGFNPAPRWLSGSCSQSVFAFLYLPIVILILYSFNGEGVGGFPPRHLTLDWYRMLFADTCHLGFGSQQSASGAGRDGDCVGLWHPGGAGAGARPVPRESVFSPPVLLPLILPGIITGLSLLMVRSIRPEHNSAC